MQPAGLRNTQMEVTGTLVGSLSTYGLAVCSDSAGNVFIVSNSEIEEYAHGGTSPIATLSLSGDQGSGCSVSPLNGDLAVVYKGDGSDVAVFPDSGGTPALYRSGIDSLFCGYDGNGNLLRLCRFPGERREAA